jgi:branched-chain amino acid transport system substrate-binding protein
LLSPSNTSPTLTKPITHEPFYARVSSNDKIQGSVVAQFVAQQLRATRAVTISDSSPYTSDLVSTFRARFAAQGRTAIGVRLDPDQPDFPALVDGVAASGATVAYFPFIGSRCSEIVQALRDDPRTVDMTLVMSDGCLTSGVLADVGNQPRLYVSGNDQRTLREDPFYADGFLPAYARSYGEQPTTPWHATAFDAANVIFDAIRRSARIGRDGALTIPREQLRAAIFEIHGYKGLSGVLTCTPDGDCAQASTIAVYEAPRWPVADANGDVLSADPVFSLYLTLADVELAPSSDD